MNMSMGVFIATHCQGEVGAGVAFTVNPSLTGDAIVGETLTVSLGTATGATALAGSLRHVSDDTEVDTFTEDGTYVIQDTDFGQQLYLHVTAEPGGVAAESDATGAVADDLSAAQTTGAEGLANPDFSTYSAGFTGWTLSPGTYGGDPGVNQTAPDGTAGTGAAQFSSTSSVALLSQASKVAAWSLYETEVEVSARVSGSLVWRMNATATLLRTMSAVGTYRDLFLATAADGIGIRNSGATNAVANRASLKEITRNVQLVAPSANMILSRFYTLPGTPIAGDQVWLLPRISDIGAGNFWAAILIYTGAQWNVNLFSYASGAPTSRIAATNIGATNGLRVVANGDSWELFTTANGGSLWTTRGTFTSSLYNTATGVNGYHTTTITAGLMTFANP